jgi:hypothetical protein
MGMNPGFCIITSAPVIHGRFLTRAFFTWVLQAALLSSMQFTHYTPGRLPPNRAASSPATLQIFSIKLPEVAGDLHWPLSVYGKVVVRDVVDRNRNFIFSRRRENSQELTQDVCIFLFLFSLLDCMPTWVVD